MLEKKQKEQKQKQNKNKRGLKTLKLLQDIQSKLLGEAAVFRWGRGCFGPDGTAVGLAPLSSPR